MKQIVILVIIVLDSILLFSQSSNDIKDIYNESINYHARKYVIDSTKKTILLDSSVCFKKDLDIVVMITRRYRYGNSLYSIYKDYLNIDTSDFRNIEKLNSNFKENTIIPEYLGRYLSENMNIRLVNHMIVDSFFIPFKEIRFKIDATEAEMDSMIQIAINCYENLNSTYDCIGYLTLSKPYIHEKNKAMIYLSFRQSPMAGHSLILLLSRENNVWVVKKEITLGVS